MLVKKLMVVGHLATNEIHTGGVVNRYWGGAGCHVALAASLFLPRNSVMLVSVCGDDYDLDVLAKAGVDMSGVDVQKNEISDKFIIREKERGERDFESVGVLSKSLSLVGKEKLLEKVSWVHLATSPAKQQLFWFGELKKIDHGDLGVSVDTFEAFVDKNPREVKEVFEKCDLLFANLIEWQNLKYQTKKPLVLKLEEKGACYYENGKFDFRVPALKVKKVVDTTGAGEVVAGVFLALRLLGKSKKKSLKVACEMASLSVEGWGIDSLLRKRLREICL
ncbi:carbohydrate kinase family protein [Patescibacteria group bacterium]|nr:carbohydrate kinase family protein [Patescibacteria group bacterium]MCG2701968.1 carbohydrate kinase family protein [Candidatus Parcubacteria bacterium]MBU4210894.1 carbohydrate kinase family protein [Patescibacteria group bacterium]MBU4265030.1 carbohydrate kinase family protein [Patescibacteria group bacterium]MBU4390183.1 carbohydrate kinase family protein [Patescibacteria group bacterium]